jgi:hypothetical protein
LLLLSVHLLALPCLALPCLAWPLHNTAPANDYNEEVQDEGGTCSKKFIKNIAWETSTEETTWKI